MERLYNTFDSVEELQDYIRKETKQALKENLELLQEKSEPIKTKDRLEVVYAEHKDYKNIFKNIIVFTNNRDSDKNKTLKNIEEAIDNLKKAKCKIIPKLYTFVSDELTYSTDDSGILTITDGDLTLDFKTISNVDTLVFSRLGVQGRDNCEHVVSLLQDRGFLVLNPVRYSELASNKYDTAVLLKKGEIPQPRFCSMTKSILYDEEQYLESMRDVYPEWSKDPDKNEDFKLVCKILDGHGGTGVFMTDGKKLNAILQTIFAVDPERQLIIQRKEEGDGGDIRVHVLTLRDEQKILACMKRQQLGGDFRSNVSLGAEAIKVELTDEQEQIALKAAKISRLPWCAVDIMPLKKGSNKEVGDNVVLELNASPGTDGISEVIGFNFINVLLNELDDPKKFYLQDKVAGFLETVDIAMIDSSAPLLAKLDTGNGAVASHLEVGDYEEKDGKVTFKFNGKSITMKVIGHSKAVTGTQEHNRPIVVAKSISLGMRKQYDIPIAIVRSRDGKSSNVLINRELLSWLGYVVSPSQTHILTPEMEKVKII